MTTIKEQVEKLGDAGTKVFGYAIIGSILNIISDSVEELELFLNTDIKEV